jgi:hypothetical protein
MPGLSALAGFIFSIICQRYGKDTGNDSFYKANVLDLGYEFSHYSSATAAAAVYGAVNLWPTAFLHLWCLRYLHKINSQVITQEEFAVEPPLDVFGLGNPSRRAPNYLDKIRLPFVFSRRRTEVTDL